MLSVIFSLITNSKLMADTIADNLYQVQQKIQQCAEKAGRDANKVRLIAVSKTRSLEEVQSIVSLGQSAFWRKYYPGCDEQNPAVK